MLTQVADTQKESLRKQQEEMFTSMSKQAQEFFRRYNNVK